MRLGSMRNGLRALAASAVTLLAGLPVHAAPVYVCVGICTPIIITDPNVPPPVEPGNLVNILDVPVGGVLYDVAFVDGTFNGIFGTTAPALAFTTGSQAQQAAQALSDTLVDVGDQYFDTNPSLTRGCAYDQACLVMTPFAVEFGGAAFRWVGFTNDNPLLGMVVGDAVGDPSGILDAAATDFASGGVLDDRTFAVWRLAASTTPPGNNPLDRFFTPPGYGDPVAVDAPGAASLMAVALLLLATARRRARVQGSAAGDRRR